MSQWRIGACVLGALLLLTGCTAASAAGYTATGAAGHATGQTAAGPNRATGHVTGKLLIEGGPIGPGGQQPGERSIPGTVTFTAAGHRPVNVGVGKSGRFSAWLPPGRYHVTGRSPDIMTVTGSGEHLERTCSQPLSATIRARHTATIAVVCIVP
jgi:hypothetical protein